LSDLPAIREVSELLRENWQIEPEMVSVWPKSPRLYRVEGYGFARVGFPRGGLRATQLVECVNTLHMSGCAVPATVPTSHGELSIELGEMALSVERSLPGEECSGANLSILPQVGRDLGTIHSTIYNNDVIPGCVRTLGEWIDHTVEKAQVWAVEWDHGAHMRAFASILGDEYRDLKAGFGLTHGDVRSPNVLAQGDRLGFVDFNPKFEPQLCDVVKIRNKWLMNGDVRFERPLTLAELSGFLSGYHETRPLSEDEVASFPIIWAVEQSWRLAQDLRSTSMFSEDRACHWPISQQINELPMAMDFGRRILATASLECVDV
jgi:Ser/Thr protein kinase RdoA (MazF antagonist)